MDRATIRKRYDEIVEFSEIRDFLHQPIKHHSSGMDAKLGFSVARISIARSCWWTRYCRSAMPPSGARATPR
jgi:hypothetical protein